MTKGCSPCFASSSQGWPCWPVEPDNFEIDHQGRRCDSALEINSQAPCDAPGLVRLRPMYNHEPDH